MHAIPLDLPTTIRACRQAGLKFGAKSGTLPRTQFETALLSRLVALADVLPMTDLDLDEAIAAFDQSAWFAWEHVRY